MSFVQETKVPVAAEPGDSPILATQPSDLEAIIHAQNDSDLELQPVNVNGIKTEPPYTTAEMVAADITYLRHRCTGKTFMQLITVYTKELYSSFEEIILNGKTQTFLEHADMNFLTQDGVKPCGVTNCSICCAWRAHHLPRMALREAADEKENKLYKEILEEESQGMYRNSVAQRSKKWHCLRTMATTYPGMLVHAARICIDEDIDPSALGPPARVMEKLVGSMAQTLDWDVLHRFYREKGLGLWPDVNKQFSLKNAEYPSLLYANFGYDGSQI